MKVKITATSKQAKPLKDSQDQETLYTGLLIDGKWYNIRGSHQNLYNKTVDLEFNGSLCRLADTPLSTSVSQGNGNNPPAAAFRTSLTQVIEVIGRVYQALPTDWAQDVNGARAYAQVIQTVLKGVIDGSVEIDNPVVPKEVTDAYKQTADWPEVK